MSDEQNEIDIEKIARDENSSMADLRKAADALKEKIDKAKTHKDMPLNSGLRNPDWDQRAADGHLDNHSDD